LAGEIHGTPETLSVSIFEVVVAMPMQLHFILFNQKLSPNSNLKESKCCGV
jgi:hypothetical protein